MKASPLLFIVCLGLSPAHAGSSYGGPGAHLGAGHGHFGGPHGGPKFFVNAVSDIEPGPAPSVPPPEPAASPEPASFEPPPPDPVYLPAPYLPEAAPARRLRPGPHILYLREPSKRRAGPIVIYGAG